MPVASFNFGWVVGRGSNSDNATSPDEAINHGRHSENISVVDDTRENVHFDGVWYTQRRKTQICWWFGLNATKFSEYFIGGHRYDAIWRKNASISFKLLFHRWDGGDGCWSPLMLWAWLVHELCDKSCWNACTFVLFVNIASLIVQQCTCTSVSDQCDLDNSGIQMGSSKEAWIRASECTLRLHVFPCFKPNKAFADAYSWLRIHSTLRVSWILSHE